jgi:hypothetical protein
MARRHPKTHAKTFQQRQTERHLADAQDRAIVEDMAKKYTCTNSIARDFASQCHERITDVDFDIVCSQIALDFWADPPAAAQPVVDVLRELATERRRYLAALTQLQDRLLAFTKTDLIHEHLPLPIEHYQEQIRDRLFPDLAPPPAQNLSASGQR